MLNEFNDENKELKSEIEQSDLISEDIVCADIQHQLLKVTDENKELKKENEQLKQKIQRWKNLYEIKDAEVTTRADALNKVCEHYASEVLFKSDIFLFILFESSIQAKIMQALLLLIPLIFINLE